MNGFDTANGEVGGHERNGENNNGFVRRLPRPDGMGSLPRVTLVSLAHLKL